MTVRLEICRQQIELDASSVSASARRVILSPKAAFSRSEVLARYLPC